jgi:uncharacterized protein (TIRG00374 family)
VRDGSFTPGTDGQHLGREATGWVVRLAVVVLVLYLTWRFLAGMEWGRVAERLEGASQSAIWLAALLLVLRFVLLDLRWRLAFRRLGRAPTRLQSFFGLLGAIFANHVVPVVRMIGGLLRARYGARFADQTFGVAYGVVLFDQVSHQVVSVSSSVLALAGFLWYLGHPWLALSTVVALLAAVAFLSSWYRARGSGGARWASRLVERLGRYGRGGAAISREGQAAVEALVTLLGDARLRRLSIVAGLGFVLLNGIAQWVVFAALGVPNSLLASLMAVALGTAVGGLTGTPGGLGTTEAGMIVTYAALEVAPIDAAAATLLYRGLHYGLVVALGLPALLLFELKGADPDNESDRRDER